MGVTSSLLLVGALNGALLAAVLARQHCNLAANRFLAALIALVSLRLGIYILGFAGAYDAHRWLTFLPLDVSLAFGPLLWLYVTATIAGRAPRRWVLHLAPAALQLSYYLVCFALPTPWKWTWYVEGHLTWVAPLGLVAVLASSAVYLTLALRQHAAYQHWLSNHLSDIDAYRLGWLRGAILAFAGLWALTAALAAWSFLVVPLDYFDRIPVMFGSCALVYGLGLLGWRHGTVVYPHATPDAAPSPVIAARVDYQALAADCRERVDAAGWWREESLSLGEVARRLALSERTLSRALNVGAGETFNSVINALRVEGVKRDLSDPLARGDLLQIAMQNGFNSKASFNRAFKQATGLTPTLWRSANQRRREIRQSTSAPEIEATAASG